MPTPSLIARGLLPIDQSTDWYPLEEDEEFIEQLQSGEGDEEGLEHQTSAY